MTQIIITAMSIRTFGCLDCITYIVSFTKALFIERLKIKNLPGCIHIVKFPLKSRNGTIAMFKNIIHVTPVAFCFRRWVIANLCQGFFEIFVAHFGHSFTCVSISATTTVVYSINFIHFSQWASALSYNSFKTLPFKISFISTVLPSAHTHLSWLLYLGCFSNLKKVESRLNISLKNLLRTWWDLWLLKLSPLVAITSTIKIIIW